MHVTISTSNYTFVDVSGWLDRLGRTYDNAKATMWDFVMTLAAGIDQFGRSDPKRAELYDLASQQTGLAVTTLRTYVSAARSPVASLAIEKDLSFQHARAVLGLAEDVADSMLADAVAGGWSPERLNGEAWAKKNGLPSQRTLNGKPPPPATNGIAHHNNYYVVGANGDEPPFVSSAMYDNAGPVVESLWTDERILAMAQAAAIEATDADGVTWQTVLVDDVCRLLRTMRDEYEIGGYL